jgi:UDP-perosamine 4-acetyltransferase
LARNLIILGAGGHAAVLVDIIKSSDEYHIIGAVADIEDGNKLHAYGIKLLGDDSIMDDHDPGDVSLVNGIGGMRDTSIRAGIFERYTSRGFEFVNIVHPSVIISGNVNLGSGVQIMAGAIIQTGCEIGDNSLVNTAASIDHDCVISCNVHISPGAVLCGNVSVAEGAHVGAGAVVIQGINIGMRALVGAGAVVVGDVPEATTVTGIPAK